MIVYALGCYAGGYVLYANEQQALDTLDSQRRSRNESPYANSVVICEVSEVVAAEVFMEILTNGKYHTNDSNPGWLRRIWR